MNMPLKQAGQSLPREGTLSLEKAAVQSRRHFFGISLGAIFCSQLNAAKDFSDQVLAPSAETEMQAITRLCDQHAKAKSPLFLINYRLGQVRDYAYAAENKLETPWKFAIGQHYVDPQTRSYTDFALAEFNSIWFESPEVQFPPDQVRSKLASLVLRRLEPGYRTEIIANNRQRELWYSPTIPRSETKFNYDSNRTRIERPSHKQQLALLEEAIRRTPSKKSVELWYHKMQARDRLIDQALQDESFVAMMEKNWDSTPHGVRVWTRGKSFQELTPVEMRAEAATHIDRLALNMSELRHHLAHMPIIVEKLSKKLGDTFAMQIIEALNAQDDSIMDLALIPTVEATIRNLEELKRNGSQRNTLAETKDQFDQLRAGNVRIPRHAYEVVRNASVSISMASSLKS